MNRCSESRASFSSYDYTIANQLFETHPIVKELRESQESSPSNLIFACRLEEIYESLLLDVYERRCSSTNINKI